MARCPTAARGSKHTGTYILRIAKSYTRNFINLIKPFAAITGDGVDIAERVPLGYSLGTFIGYSKLS